MTVIVSLARLGDEPTLERWATVRCPSCEGRGQVECCHPGGLVYPDGDWHPCQDCDGRGEQDLDLLDETDFGLSPWRVVVRDRWAVAAIASPWPPRGWKPSPRTRDQWVRLVRRRIEPCLDRPGSGPWPLLRDRDGSGPDDPAGVLVQALADLPCSWTIHPHGGEAWATVRHGMESAG